MIDINVLGVAIIIVVDPHHILRRRSRSEVEAGPLSFPEGKKKIYSHLIKRVHLWLYWDRHLPFFMDTTSTFSSISGVIYDTRKISYERVDRKREKERGLPTGCERGQMSETLKRKE